MAKQGTYINQALKYKLKEFAVRQVVKRITLSPLGQEYLDALEALALVARQIARMQFPIDDMLVLKKYDQHDFTGCVTIECVGKRGTLWVPLVPRKFVERCLTTGSPIQHYQSQMKRTLVTDIPRLLPRGVGSPGTGSV